MAIRQLDLSLAPKTALYLRISKDSERLGLGVERQRKDCEALARLKGWHVGETYCDNDRSATRKNGQAADRPEWRRLLADIEAGRIGAVVAWDIDRLARDPLEAEQFFLLCERAGMHRVATPADDVDISTGEGIMLARIKGAVAAEEVRKMSRRIRAKKFELAEAGLPSGGGPRRFGFEPDGITVREEEAAILREAAARVLAGRSLGVLCRELTEKGVPTPQGGPWRQTSIRRALLRPSTAGLREHRGAILGEAVWPAIIPRAEWETVCAILNDPTRKPLAGNRRTRLLTGILACGACGTKMTATSGGTRRGGEPRYQCASANGGCGRVGVAGRHIEPLVIGAVREALASDEFVAAYRDALHGDDSDAEALTATVTGCEAKLKELAGLWAADELSKAEWMTARTTVEARLEAARAALSARQIRRSPLEGLTGPGVFDERWPDLSHDEQRALLADLIERVEVFPARSRGGRTFDPGRVGEPVWRR